MKETLKLALEALTNAIAVRNGEGGTKLVSPLEKNAITAIKEALAQPEQEPVAFPNRRAVEREIERIQNPKGMHLNDGKERVILPGGTLRYLLALADRATSPQRPWVGLTDDEVEDCMEMSIQKTCRAIEAKLKEKNT